MGDLDGITVVKGIFRPYRDLQTRLVARSSLANHMRSWPSKHLCFMIHAIGVISNRTPSICSPTRLFLKSVIADGTSQLMGLVRCSNKVNPLLATYFQSASQWKSCLEDIVWLKIFFSKMTRVIPKSWVNWRYFGNKLTFLSIIPILMLRYCLKVGSTRSRWKVVLRMEELGFAVFEKNNAVFASTGFVWIWKNNTRSFPSAVESYNNDLNKVLHF